jgi:hypothetical protein
MSRRNIRNKRIGQPKEKTQSKKTESKPSRRKRDTTVSFGQFQQIGRQFFNRLLQITIVTITATVVYYIFFPLSSTFIFNLFGVEQNFPVFPQFSSSIDYYALYGFILFILIQIAIIRIFFVRDNDIILVAFLSALVSFGVMIIVNFFLFPLLAFIYGTSAGVSPVGIGSNTLTQPLPQQQILGITVSNLNLFGFIFLYDAFFVLFSLTLLRRKRNREMTR